MNILMIHPHDLFSRQEPWTIRIKKIGLEFVRKEHEVKIVYFPLVYRPHQKSFYLEGIEFIPLNRRVGMRNFLSNIKAINELCKWSDIVHFQKCFYHAALPSVIGAFIQNKPLHYDWDDWEIKIFNYSAKQPWLLGIFVGALERFLPMLCDTVSVSSQCLKEECLRYGLKEKNIAMAPVGADLEMFDPRISGIRVRERFNIKGQLVLYLGQLHGAQYAEQFIKAAKIVLNEIGPITFMIVGSGYRLAELKVMAENLDLDNHIIFTGSVPHRDAPLYLAAADVAVACFEDNDITKCKSPLKIVEYLASGKSIVASNVGEVKRMLGGAGVMCVPGDSQSLAEGICKLLLDDPLRYRLQKKARQRAEDIYNWKNTAENLLKTYAMTVG